MTEPFAHLITEEVIKFGAYRKIIAEHIEGRSQLTVDFVDTKFQIDQDSIMVMPTHPKNIDSD